MTPPCFLWSAAVPAALDRFGRRKETKAAGTAALQTAPSWYGRRGRASTLDSAAHRVSLGCIRGGGAAWDEHLRRDRGRRRRHGVGGGVRVGPPRAARAGPGAVRRRPRPRQLA